MLKNNELRFSPAQLAQDYDFTYLVERYTGKIIGDLIGERAVDFSTGPRTSHDWAYGDSSIGIVTIELKTTSNVTFAVELSKDREGLIKSGIGATTADLVAVLAMGRGATLEGDTRGPDVGKLRLYRPKALRAATYGREPMLIRSSPNVTEDAYVVNIDPRTPTHWHVGDVPTVLAADGVTWLYSLGDFIPAAGADTRLRALFAEIRESKKNNE